MGSEEARDPKPANWAAYPSIAKAVLGAFVEGSTGAAQTGATGSASRRRSRSARPAGSTSEGRLTTSSGTPILVSETSRTLLRAPKRSERWLQQLIHRHPTCLPMDEIEPGIGRLIPVCMELPLRVRSVDNLFITPEGNLVIVEVKLWGKPEARRQVVAQTLEYATALFRLDYTKLDDAVRKADFYGAERPERLYSLVDGADASPRERVRGPRFAQPARRTGSRVDRAR